MSPMDDRSFDLIDLPPDVARLVSECELTGRRTVFLRGGKPVALVVSHDEYLALRETVALAADPALIHDLQRREDEARRGALYLPEDLFVE